MVKVNTQAGVRIQPTQAPATRPSETTVEISAQNQPVESQPVEIQQPVVQQQAPVPQQQSFVQQQAPVVANQQQYPVSQTIADANHRAAEEAAARDLGSLAQPRGMTQEDARQISGMAQASDQMARSRGVPVVDASDIESLAAMSSRPDEYSQLTMDAAHAAEQVFKHQAASNEELRSARSSSRGPISTPIPSQMAAKSIERNAREQEKSRKRLAQEARLDRMTGSSDETQKISGRPNNAFNIPFGYDSKDRTPKIKKPSTKRPSSLKDKAKDIAASAFKRKNVGVRTYGKMLGLRRLGLREVGVGMQEIAAVASRDPKMLDNLLAPYLNGESTGMMSSAEIAKIINNNEVYVATFKPPGNSRPDAQRRRLRVLTDHQRGIYLHPIMAAMYTADFDGDDMEVSYDPNVSKLIRDPMVDMVGIDGEQKLNTDFLSVAELVDGYEDGKTAHDFVLEYMLTGIDGRIASPLVDAIIRLGKTANKSGEQAAAWGDVFREARRVSDILGNGEEKASDGIMERICQSVQQTMRYIAYQNMLTSIDADIVDSESLPAPRTYDDSAIYKVIEGMVEGEVPNNFQDLKLLMTGYLGNVEGKNAPFRFTADVGKMMKMDSRLRIGDEFRVDPNNREHMQMFFESTVKFAASRRMAREVKVAGRAQYYMQLMRQNVIEEVGFPESYESFSEFLTRFYQSYNRNSSIINEANLVFMSNMGIASNSNRNLVSPLRPTKGGSTPTLADIAEPFLSVYGTYSVGRMFNALSTSGIMGNAHDTLWSGNPGRLRSSRPVEREFDYHGDERFWITGKYLNYNLRQFRNENRLVVRKNDDSFPEGIKGIRSTRVGDTFVMNNDDIEFYLLLTIADKRTGASSIFNKNMYGMTEGHTRASNDSSTISMMSKLLTELVRLSSQGDNMDQMAYVDNVVQTLVMSGPDMFYHFDMDNTVGFLQSKWAQKMIEHFYDPEVLGGIRTAMVFDYRMERIMSLTESASNPNPKDNITHWLNDVNNLDLAIDELGASSEVWHGIIREFEAEATDGMDSVFKMMRERGALITENVTGTRPYVWADPRNPSTVTLDASSFWQNPGNHTTLRSVIEDLDMDRQTKWNVIADVVRYWENDAYLKSYEVGYQLEIGNDSSYDLNSGPSQSALGTYKDFEQSFNRWGKVCQYRLKEEVEGAYKNWGTPENHGMLIRTLERMSKSPWELIQIDDMMYADSILSVMDKTYAQTEKSSQHPWTNAIYAALSYQRVGGYMNDVTRTNDRLLGTQNTGSINIADIVHLLADPEFMIETYNEYGERGILTRESLLTSFLGRDLSEDIEFDIWEFLRQNPRIASAIRQHNACVNTDTSGSGYLGATKSISETIGSLGNGASSPLEHVRYLMRDHPVYAAIISLVTPMSGKVSRNQRNRIHETERYLSARIYQLASDRDMPAGQAAMVIMKDLGLGSTSDVLRETMRSDYDKYLDALGLAREEDTSESDNDADIIFNTASTYLARYIDEVRNSDVRLGGRITNMSKPSNLGVDISSLASFWDVIQELSGAKTYMSTRIEGGETYQLAEWASHISAKDHYADLEATDEVEIDERWNGAWTNLMNPDGTPMTLSVDENGLSNYDELLEASKEQGVDEIVVMTPLDYMVKDRSTDSYGTQVPSLFMYLVSKRSNGAEKFNLKAKKTFSFQSPTADSITKMSDGKYRMETDEDGNRYRTSFMETEEKLRKVARQNGDNGLLAAKTELAGMLLRENEALGYKDMTLANYMCIADLMLIEGDDGNIYLRSLEMLFSAIKYRLGADVDEMSDAEIREAADAIVNDTSESGVGIAQMSSPFDVLADFRPKAKSYAASTSGIRQNSSVFERNFDLLSQIVQSARDKGIEPMSPTRAEALDGGYRRMYDVGKFLKNLDSTRNYSIVGHAGFNADERIAWTVGPSHAIVIGNRYVPKERVAEICEKAWQLGMTVIVGSMNRNKIPAKFVKDAMPCGSKGEVLIPCFDMRLNGSEATPYNGGRFAIFQAPYSRYVVSVEDSTNEFELGDAQAQPTRSFTDRIHVIDNGSEQVTAEDLFPNVFRNPDFRHSLTSITLARGDEIRQLIANGVKCTIDYGVVEDGRGFEQRKKDVLDAVKRYQERWPEADPDGIMRGGMTECHPGDIVGWAQCEIYDQLTSEAQYVLAPIIPFPLHGATKGRPEKFTVESLAYADQDNTIFSIDWSNTTDVNEGNAKYFDSSGGANKGMMDFVETIDDQRVLRDGTPVDVYIASASTDSRKIGTDRRIKTMISLMALARMHGYNFAESDGAFPDDPDIREIMLSKRLPTSFWHERLSGNQTVTFSADEKLNAFLNYECRKILTDGGNPSDYLANVYTDANGTRHNTHIMWEFEAMFDQGTHYEDSLLRFLHTMDPTLCPNGLDDDGDSYTFRLKRDGKGLAQGYDSGVLQMQVPHRMADGQMSYVWDNVYIGMSFFGEDYSGFSIPNIDGASNFLDAMNTMAYHGVQLDEISARFRAMWATADIGRVIRDGGALGKA